MRARRLPVAGTALGCCRFSTSNRSAAAAVEHPEKDNSNLVMWVSPAGKLLRSAQARRVGDGAPTPEMLGGGKNKKRRFSAAVEETLHRFTVTPPGPLQQGLNTLSCKMELIQYAA